ncbi:hypothetical protein [Flagellimonas meridianipacifica]|uniref:Uncharacterized protein n=1 Tax=Flagellimonas meridianipacifica TaxID=1080225 RepID=A0A2T0MAU6_9FLAO|nr:hypothetical protein [Allomuricauda pacifica]PRX54613.1 hypothetical protein CLV81_3015 [Allomuricauda pacifica]
MKTVLFLLTVIVLVGTDLTAQSKSREIPSKKISSEKIKPFVDSLRQKILSDTLRFNRRDLSHVNGRTKNQNPYSMLITVNMKYSYRLDIVENHLVKEFVNSILDSENIESIVFIEKENTPILGGHMASEGWIFITLIPKIKLDFEVGGLKYRKGKKRKGGDNFLQRKKGEIMIRT